MATIYIDYQYIEFLMKLGIEQIIVNNYGNN